MDVTEQYPSTFDLPRIMGAQDDPVLAMLQGARRRYQRGMSQGAYIEGGYVCAVGAVMSQAGLTGPVYDDLERDVGVGAVGMGRLLKEAEIEQPLIDAAKEAIVYLNRAARKLYPESKNYRKDFWSGPLEWVNQEWRPDDLPEVHDLRDHGDRDRFHRECETRADALQAQVKEAVLACYDYAIKQRSKV
jgi:hypothetical protein